MLLNSIDNPLYRLSLRRKKNKSQQCQSNLTQTLMLSAIQGKKKLSFYSRELFFSNFNDLKYKSWGRCEYWLGRRSRLQQNGCGNFIKVVHVQLNTKTYRVNSIWNRAIKKDQLIDGTLIPMKSTQVTWAIEKLCLSKLHLEFNMFNKR